MWKITVALLCLLSCASGELAATEMPMMQFQPQNYTVSEEAGHLLVPIWRTGDLSHSSSVRCYTRQGSAIAGNDFKERPNTNSSNIVFQEGEMRKYCTLELINDNKHEMDKTLTLVLGSPACASCDSALVGPIDVTTITIVDSNDYPLIGFEKTRVVVQEPRLPDSPVSVNIPIVRQGDLSHSAFVRVYTKDGSAQSGKDYTGKSAEIEFHPNVSEVNFHVDILYSKEREIPETFTVHLNPAVKTKVKIMENKMTVYIEEQKNAAGVTFPSPPVVVSLRDYDNVTLAHFEPMAGYPVICITACNPQHPEYSATARLCTNEGINNNLTEYRWYVGSSISGIMRPVTDEVFFASTRKQVLDSIYFNAGSAVRCAVQAMNDQGISGRQVMSEPVSISKVFSMCRPPHPASFGAEPFSAKLRLTGPDDPVHPNLVKMSVEIQHRDGMFPAISTWPLTNLDLSLSRHGIRVGTHKCSNLLEHTEVQTMYGFISDNSSNIYSMSDPEPYEFSAELRSESTLRFYHNLDLELCMWRYESYFSLSELVSECGATVSAGNPTHNLVQSSLEVEVPLYISFIYLTGGLQHTDLSTKLRLTFTYDTTVMWQHGVTSSRSSKRGGRLYPKSMKINKDGLLVVHFQTEAHFNGLFVVSHPQLSVASSVISRKNKDLAYSLYLIKSSPTFAQPQQDWEFISNYAVQDYSGIYDVSLIPCEVQDGIPYSRLAPCSPQSPVNFELEVRFQQMSDPVPTEFSLDTQFYLSKQKDVWLIDSLEDFEEDWDAAYEKGDKIYGRIMINPLQNLRDSFILSIEKCFLCNGVDGYIPKFNPETEEFGCIAKSPNILHNFKIIDSTSPSSRHVSYNDIPFDAVLLGEDEDKLKKSGSDGFSFSPDPLFQISPGKQWFVHCIYMVNSRHTAGKQMFKRSVVDPSENPLHTVNPIRKDKVKKEYLGVGKNGKGTNLHHIELHFTPEMSRYEDPYQKVFRKIHLSWWFAVIISSLLGTFIVVQVIIGCVMISRKRTYFQNCLLCARVQVERNDV